MAKKPSKTAAKPVAKPVAKPKQDSKPPDSRKEIKNQPQPNRTVISNVPAYDPRRPDAQDRTRLPSPNRQGDSIGDRFVVPAYDPEAARRRTAAESWGAIAGVNPDWATGRPTLGQSGRPERVYQQPREIDELNARGGAKLGRSTAPPVPAFVRAPLGGAYFDVGTQLARNAYNGRPGVIRPPVGGVDATDEAFVPAYQAGESGGFGGGESGGYDNDGYNRRGYSRGGYGNDYDSYDDYDYVPRYGGGGGGRGGGGDYPDRELPPWLAGLMSWRF